MYHQPPSKLRGLPAANSPNTNYPEPIGQPPLPALHRFSGSHGHRRPFRSFYSLGASHPSSWMWYLQSGHISHLLGLFLESCVLAASLGTAVCLALPNCRGMQTFLGLTREQQSLWRKWVEHKTTPCTPRMQTLMHFFSTSTHPLPAVSFSRRNFSASRFCSSLLLQGLAQPRCSRDGVRWSLEVPLQSATTALASPHTLHAVFVCSPDGGRVCITNYVLDLEIKSSPLL